MRRLTLLLLAACADLPAGPLGSGTGSGSGSGSGSLTSQPPNLPTSQPPDGALPVDGGFLEATQAGTIARFQYAFGPDDIAARAARAAGAKPPNHWKTLLVIVKETSLRWRDEDGKHKEAPQFTDADLPTLEAWFQEFSDNVFAYTGGAIRVDHDTIEIDRPITLFHDTWMDRGTYWLDETHALEARGIDRTQYDNVMTYFPSGDTPIAYEGLMQGGSSPDDRPIDEVAIPGSIDDPDNRELAVSTTMHEWMHDVAAVADEIVGYSDVADIHWLPGWATDDGGLPEEIAAYGDRMAEIPEGFWRSVHASGPASDGPTRPDAGALYRWPDVADDWEARMPLLDEDFLRERSGLPDLALSIDAPSERSARLLIDGVGGKDSGDALVLDNVMTLDAPTDDGDVADPWGGYRWRRIESMAVVHEKQGGDLVFVRLDVAGPVLELLGAKLRGVLGFVSVPARDDQYPTVFVVAEGDLGNATTEVEALGATPTFDDGFHGTAIATVDPYEAARTGIERAVDRSEDTWYWSARAIAAGDAFTFDLGDQPAGAMVTILGGAPGAEDDYVQDGVVEASADGATWFELGVARDAEVRVAAPRPFRWVRLRALSDQDNWLALRDVRAVR